MTLLLEAESLDTAGSKWQVIDLAGASGGQVLYSEYFDATDAAVGAINLPHPGRWRVWVRCYNTPGTYGQFLLDLCDEDGAIVARQLLASTPAPVSGIRWECLEAKAPWAGRYCIRIARVTHARSPYDPRRIDVLLVTDDLAFTPEGVPAAVMPTLVPLPQPPAVPPPGTPYLSTAAMNDWHFFSGAAPGQEPFRLSVTQTPSSDLVQLIRYGGNATEGYQPGFPSLPLASAAISTLPESYATEIRAAGLVVNADGTDGAFHSIFYPPFRQYALEQSARFARTLGVHDTGRDLLGWALTNEMSGYFDWSRCAQDAFRAWLAQRYGNFAAINAVWGTTYPSLAAVEAPRDRGNLAAWIDWWRFHEAAWAEFVGKEAKARRDADPAHPPVIVKFSDLDLEYANFVGQRTIDYELMAEALRPYGNRFAMDMYGTGDRVSLEAELLRSLVSQRCWFTEYNQHTDDAHAMLANLWTATAKGIRGLFVFCRGGVQSNRHDDWKVFGMHAEDETPRSRMLATTRFFHAVHRLEPLLMASRRVKPAQVVGLYYPRLDIGIGGLPALNTYGETIDPLLPVYARLRRLGYPVDIVSERQVLQGKLDSLAAIVLVNARHLPSDACRRLETFIRRGGVVIADARAGWYDDHHREQHGLSALCGIEEGPARYDLNAGVELHGLDGWSATARGREDIRPRAGARIEARFADGMPAAIACTTGAGRSVYVGAMLGSMTPDAGPLLRRALEAGHIAPQYRIDGLSPAARAGLCVEPAWVDAAGNQFIIVTNFNAATGPYTLSLPREAHNRSTLALWADARGMTLAPVRIRQVNGVGQAALPGIDAAGVLLLLQDMAPLVGAELPGIPDDETGTPVLHPGQNVLARITVHNGSRHASANLHLRLYTPRGWFQETAAKPIPLIAAGGSLALSFNFRVAQCERPQIAPITLKLERNGKPLSTPCTVMVKIVE